MSAWVNQAMRRYVEDERALRALDDTIAAFEAEHGVINDEELEQAERWLRERARIVNSPSPPRSQPQDGAA